MSEEDKYIYQKRYYYKHKEEIYKKLKNKLQNDKEFREKRNIKGRDLRRKKSKELINLRKILTELEDYLNQKMGQQNLYDYQKLAYQNIYLKIKRLKEKYK